MFGRVVKECLKENKLFLPGVIFFLLSMLLRFISGVGSGVLTLIVSVLAYVLLGFDVFSELIEDLSEKRFFSESMLMTVSSLGAFLIGEQVEACAVMLLFSIGEMLEETAHEKSESSIRSLVEMKPAFAMKENGDGMPVKADAESLLPGDIVLVRNGDTVPCDGTVLSGEGSLDTSPISGESVPRYVGPQSEVLCGCIVSEGSLRVRVKTAYGDNTYSKILKALAEGRDKKSSYESFTTGFAKIYTPIVMALSVLVFILGTLFTSETFTWLYRALVFLAVSCPCAFVISVPLCFFFGIGEMSKHGFLVKGSETAEKLAQVTEVAFDKTGTLTVGKLGVTRVTSTGRYSSEELLTLAASLERFSSHPIAAELLRYADEKGCDVSKMSTPEDVREVAGRGIEGRINGHLCRCGRASFACGEHFPEPSCGGETQVCISVDSEYAGIITLSDCVREDALKSVGMLTKLGIKRTHMLTGDNKESAERIAKQLGISDVHSELLPYEKSEHLRKIKSRNKDGKVAFCGDGINDAPVLAEADVGVAIGDSGAAIAVESADAVILADSLICFPLAVCACKRMMRRVKCNVTFALLVKGAVMLLSLLGFAELWMAVLGDVGVTLLVILNSLRSLYK